jgi:glycerophosphoryl diester phosphodiesterase
LKVVVWTVDNSDWIDRARNNGVKALITNDPEMMVRERDAAITD